jgi:hypothetical protein
MLQILNFGLFLDVFVPVYVHDMSRFIDIDDLRHSMMPIHRRQPLSLDSNIHKSTTAAVDMVVIPWTA